MGYITRLPTAGAATLPTLGDIGYISKQNLKGLYLVNGGSGLVDASGNGNTLTQSAGSILPPYAAGVLQFRIANTQQLNTGVTVTGPNQTIIVASKKLSAPTNGMFLGCHKTAQLAGSNAGPMTMFEGSNGSNGSQAQSWGLQAKRPTVNYSGNLVGSWAVWVATRDASGTSLSLNGQAPVTVAYTTADPGTTTTNPVVLGDDTGGVRHIDADIGFLAVYDRAMGAAEIASVYKALKRLMLAKGISL